MEALKVLKSVSGDDKKKEEEAPALLQVSSSLSAAAREQAQNLVAMVKDLAKKHRSNALLHLASRIQAMVRYGEDPFGKIKNLIQDMIAKLEREAGSEAQEKAYCDGELKKTGDKKVDLEDKVSSMTTKIDQAIAIVIVTIRSITRLITIFTITTIIIIIIIIVIIIITIVIIIYLFIYYYFYY